MRWSLENRARRLEERLKWVQTMVKTALPALPEPEEIEEMDFYTVMEIAQVCRECIIMKMLFSDCIMPAVFREIQTWFEAFRKKLVPQIVHTIQYFHV